MGEEGGKGGRGPQLAPSHFTIMMCGCGRRGRRTGWAERFYLAGHIASKLADAAAIANKCSGLVHCNAECQERYTQSHGRAS